MSSHFHSIDSRKFPPAVSEGMESEENKRKVKLAMAVATVEGTRSSALRPGAPGGQAAPTATP